MAMLTSERIKSLAPLGAQTYRLLTKLSDGTSRLFPSDQASFFRIGEAPAHVPIGKYTICYYDSSNQLITYLEDGLQLTESPEGLVSRPVQLPLNFLNAAGQPAAAGLIPAGNGTPVATVPATSGGAAISQGGPIPTGTADPEYRRYLHAMDLEDRQQEFIRNSTYVKEVGEVFMLNRMMRREMLEMQRVIVEQSGNAYKDIEQIKGTIHELLALEKAVLGHAATQLARPPAPPPDYVGLGHSALTVIKEIGVALISRSKTSESEGTLRGSTAAAPQLQASSVDAAPSSALPKPDGLEHMIQKLKGLSDAELAVSMSSPEGWKALLDGLNPSHKPEKSTTLPEALGTES